MRRKAAALGLAFAGAGLVFVEFLWTTGDTRELSFLPPFAAGILVFLLGLAGLFMIYFGYRMLRSK